MSYSLTLCDAKSRKPLHAGKKHNFAGGTYILGGTTELFLNVTYNYSRHYYRVLGDRGLYALNGMLGKDSIPYLQAGINKLGDDVTDEYWEPTEGNAKKALMDLVELAKMAPHGVWMIS
jgi:hypothetical protein